MHHKMNFMRSCLRLLSRRLPSHEVKQKSVNYSQLFGAFADRNGCLKYAPNFVVQKRLESNTLLKSKSELKAESLQKLAQLQNSSNINSFPLFNANKSPNCDPLSDEFKQMLTTLQSLCDTYKASNFPSVTSILSATMSPKSLAMLERWKRNKILELGEEGFKTYQQSILSRGKLLHQNIRLTLQGKDMSSLTITPNIEKLWYSLRHVLPSVNEVKLCEAHTCHPFLCYKGIVDCMAVFDNNIAIIEWKTSEKLKPTLDHLYDNPIQAVAYMGAINFDESHSLHANEALLIYAYEDGTDAQIHKLNSNQCQQYWKIWLARLTNYWSENCAKSS